jgi:hypothetical protein
MGGVLEFGLIQQSLNRANPNSDSNRYARCETLRTAGESNEAPLFTSLIAHQYPPPSACICAICGKIGLIPTHYRPINGTVYAPAHISPADCAD